MSFPWNSSSSPFRFCWICLSGDILDGDVHKDVRPGPAGLPQLLLQLLRLHCESLGRHHEAQWSSAVLCAAFCFAQAGVYKRACLPVSGDLWQYIRSDVLQHPARHVVWHQCFASSQVIEDLQSHQVSPPHHVFRRFLSCAPDGRVASAKHLPQSPQKAFFFI